MVGIKWESVCSVHAHHGARNLSVSSFIQFSRACVVRKPHLWAAIAGIGRGGGQAEDGALLRRIHEVNSEGQAWNASLCTHKFQLFPEMKGK